MNRDMWSEAELSKLKIPGDFTGGLYNDGIGHANGMGSWKSWINGGVYNYPVKDGTENYYPVPDFWKTKISGGEINSIPGGDIPVLWFENDYIGYTLAQSRDTHLTYAGVSFLPILKSDPRYAGTYARVKDNLELFLRSLGYRFWVSSVLSPQKINAGEKAEFELIIENSGSAPFYMDGYYAEISLISSSGEVMTKKALDADIKSWIPGGQALIKCGFDIPAGLPAGSYHLAFSVRKNEKDALKLANITQPPRGDLRYVLTAIEISGE
jgi:hypothetical protein